MYLFQTLSYHIGKHGHENPHTFFNVFHLNQFYKNKNK